MTAKISLRRREFGLLCAGASLCPLCVNAQALDLPLIGYVSGAFAETSRRRMASLRRGLGEFRYVEGKNLSIDYRWSENHIERVPTIVKELARLGAKLIITDGAIVTFAARSAVGAIPSLFLAGFDPVQVGLVQSLNRPGKNWSGVVLLNTQLTQKRVELLNEALPGLSSVGFFGRNQNPNFPTHRVEMAAAAAARHLTLFVFPIGAEADFEPAFRALSRVKSAAFVIQADPWFDARADRIIALSTAYKIPAMYQWREQAEAGGLISYGANILDAYRMLGGMAAEILGGRNPAELPIQQAAKIEMVVNLKTAKSLGITIPESVILRADEVIE